MGIEERACPQQVSKDQSDPNEPTLRTDTTTPDIPESHLLSR